MVSENGIVPFLQEGISRRDNEPLFLHNFEPSFLFSSAWLSSNNHFELQMTTASGIKTADGSPSGVKLREESLSVTVAESSSDM